jgi:hypothetical protein
LRARADERMLRPMRRPIVLCGCAVALVGCGLDAGGLLDTSDAASVGVLDGTVDVMVDQGQPGPSDAAADATAESMSDASPPSPDGGPCVPDDSGACFVVPTGWTPIAVDLTDTATCPSGFVAPPVEVVEGPTATSSACGCPTCNETALPTCTSGAVHNFFDFNGGQCGTPGQPSQSNNNPPGTCLTDLYTGGWSLISDVQYVPPSASGGSCTAPSSIQKSGITFAGRGRVCTPSGEAAMNCDDAGLCAPQLPAPFSVCVSQSGNQSCPAPFSIKHYAGTDVTFNCAACGCHEVAACAGTMTTFTDGSCQSNAWAVAADGKCRGTGNPNRSNGSYIFTGTVASHQCSIISVPTATNLALVNDQTICCAP